MDGQSQRVKKSSFDQFRKNKFLLTQKGMRKENFMILQIHLLGGGILVRCCHYLNKQ